MIDLDLIEKLIREGRLKESRQLLRRARLGEISRPLAPRASNLARRAGLSQLSVRLLNPIVRPDKNLLRPANENEKAEYAAALTQIGARSEALELLESLNPEKNVDILLFRSFAHFSQWDYSKAIPLLERYVDRHPNAYQKVVGQVNLSAALVHETQLEKAEALLAKVIREAQKASYSRLHANALELRAQLYILKFDFEKAEQDLNHASALLQEASALDDFFVMKWKTLLSVRGKPTPDKIKRFETLRQEALARSHWETVRDSDFYLARFTSDPQLFTHLYHGTPFESFRRRIEEAVSESESIPRTYNWFVGPKGASPPVFSLATGEGGGGEMKPGQIMHRLIRALAADFYRPVRTATLFSVLFGGEYYNPVSSPHRVHQNVLRLREWFSEHRLPISVDPLATGYRLSAKAPVIIRTDLERGPATRVEAVLSKARELFGAGTFGTRDLVEVTGLSKRTVLRILEEAQALQKIGVAAAGRSTRYRLI